MPRTAACLIALLMVSAGAAAAEPTTMSTTEPTARYSAVRIETLEPMHVARYRAWSAEPEHEASEFMEAWIDRHGLRTPQTRHFGRDIDVPSDRAAPGVRGYEVFLTAPADGASAPGDGVDLLEVPGGPCAVLTIDDPFRDPLTSIPGGWAHLMQWVSANGHSPRTDWAGFEEVVDFDPATKNWKRMHLYVPLLPHAPTEPEWSLTDVRTGTMRGFDYFHVSERTTMQDLHAVMDRLIDRLAELMKLAGAEARAPILLVFRDGRPDGSFAMDVGRPIGPLAKAPQGASVRRVPDTFCSSVIVSGAAQHIPAAHDALRASEPRLGLSGGAELREWFLYYEGSEHSRNNVTMMQFAYARPPATRPSEPPFSLGPIRAGTLRGLTYFYAGTDQAYDDPRGTLEQLNQVVLPAARQAALPAAPLVVRYLGFEPGKTWTLQAGQEAPDGTTPAGGALVQRLEAFACGSMVYRGDVANIGVANGALDQRLRGEGFELTGEYREYYLYWEGPDSPNNVILLCFGVVPDPLE